MTHAKSQEDLGLIRPGVHTNNQLQRVAILLVILVGFWLRFFMLDSKELTSWEGFVHTLSQFRFSMIARLFLEMDQPLLLGSFWLQRAWHFLTGSSEFAIRSISVLCGTLAVPLVYLIAKEMRLSAFTTLTATLFVAINSYAIMHGQYVLINSVSMSLVIASAVLALRVIGGSGSKKVLIAYALCTAAIIYTHVFAILVLLAQNLYVLFFMARDRRGSESVSTSFGTGYLRSRWFVSQIAVGVFCIPWLVSAWPQIADFNVNVPSASRTEMFVLTFGRSTLGVNVPGEIGLSSAGLFAAAITAAAVLGAVFTVRRRMDLKDGGSDKGSDGELLASSETQASLPQYQHHHSTVLLLPYLLIPLLAVCTPTQAWPFCFGSSHAIAQPPFLLLLAIGATNIGGWAESWLGWRWSNWANRSGTSGPFSLNRIRVFSVAAASIILIIVAGNLFGLRGLYFDPDFIKSRGLRELSVALDRWTSGLDQEEAHFAMTFSEPALWYYYTGGVELTHVPHGPNDAEGALEAVDKLRNEGILRFILPVREDGDQAAADVVRQALASSYQLAGQETVGPWLVELYARPDPQRWRLFDVEFTNGLTLERAQVSPNFPPSGGRLVVHTEWTGDPATLTGGEKLFLHLLDESGNLVAQWDPEFRMDGSLVLTSVAMPIPETLPSGPMRLIAGLYDVNTEGAPRILSESGEESLLLVYFQVAACDACGR